MFKEFANKMQGITKKEFALHEQARIFVLSLHCMSNPIFVCVLLSVALVIWARYAIEQIFYVPASSKYSAPCIAHLTSAQLTNAKTKSAQRPIAIVMHICPINHWTKIVQEQLHCIAQSGLLDIKTTKLLIGTSLPYDALEDSLPYDAHSVESSKCAQTVLEFVRQTLQSQGKCTQPEVIAHSNNKTYENSTVNALLEYTKQQVQETYVLYVHNKGSFHADKRNDAWRQFMMHHLVKEYATCIPYLEMYQTVGTHLSRYPLHYSGNFWWARSSLLQTLPSITDLTYRYHAERLFQNMEESRMFNIHKRKLHFWNSFAKT